jgi:hypothetical protein
MIKNTKNSIANTNAIMQTVPCIISWLLKAKMHCSKGKNNNVINPIAEPAPWILDDIVTFSFDSFTLNSPDSIPAPTANMEIEINVNTANTLETAKLFLKNKTEANSKKTPNHTSQAL